MTTLFCLLALQSGLISLPVSTAYPDPHPDGATISDEGALVNWSSPKTKIEWGGFLTHAGRVSVQGRIVLPVGVTARYRFQYGSYRKEAEATGTGSEVSLDFGTMQIAKPTWVKFFLQGVKTSGKDFGELRALDLTGDGVQDARFNLKPRRNAASVHLNWPLAKGDNVDWFYNEVVGQRDPFYTYYMACGFSRGYMGMQVNDPGERRVIFSIWDSGKEGVDRNKVAAQDQVSLLAKGDQVYASGFGNEGTGGHSHLKFIWKKDAVERFLVHAEPKGSTTIYTGYFYDPDRKQWRIIASFSAPKDGKYLHGLYSFVEDFVGDNGNLQRRALFGPAWIHVVGQGWKPIDKARFTHDVTGGKDRFDYDFGIDHFRFFLQTADSRAVLPRSTRPPNFQKGQ